MEAAKKRRASRTGDYWPDGTTNTDNIFSESNHFLDAIALAHSTAVPNL